MKDALELTPKKDVLLIIGDWNAKEGSQETLGVTGKFGLGIRNEAGQRLIKFCQENALVIANTLFQREEELKSLLMKVKDKSEKTDLKLSIQKSKIIFFPDNDGEALYSQQTRD